MDVEEACKALSQTLNPDDEPRRSSWDFSTAHFLVLLLERAGIQRSELFEMKTSVTEILGQHVDLTRLQEGIFSNPQDPCRERRFHGLAQQRASNRASIQPRSMPSSQSTPGPPNSAPDNTASLSPNSGHSREMALVQNHQVENSCQNSNKIVHSSRDTPSVVQAATFTEHTCDLDFNPPQGGVIGQADAANIAWDTLLDPINFSSIGNLSVDRRWPSSNAAQKGNEGERDGRC